MMDYVILNVKREGSSKILLNCSGFFALGSE